MSTATTNTALTNAYQLIGAGPGIITLEIGLRGEIHLTPSATPSAGSAFHSLIQNTDRTWMQVPAGMTAYARKRANDDSTVIAFTQN